MSVHGCSLLCPRNRLHRLTWATWQEGTILVRAMLQLAVKIVNSSFHINSSDHHRWVVEFSLAFEYLSFASLAAHGWISLCGRGEVFVGLAAAWGSAI
jgi:hypothetical protein